MHPRVMAGRTAGAAATLLALLAVTARPARAHAGPPPTPADIWWAWDWSPAVLLPLAIAGGLFGHGVAAIWRRAGIGRGVPPWRVAAFGGGLVAVALALLSPVDALAGALLAAHMVQHLLLILVAPPLLVLGVPLLPLLWALPAGARRAVGGWWRAADGLRAVWRALTRPLVAGALHVVALWVWHLPGPYAAALGSEAVHIAEHASFLGTGLLFWWMVLQPVGRRRVGYGTALLATAVMAMQGGLLGALMLFARQPWYPAYADSAAWGLTALEDQQLAGAIMWVPAGFGYLIAAAAIFLAWMAAAEREAASATPRIRDA